MNALTQMYQQLILDHAKHPVGRGELRDATAINPGELLGQSHQVNPQCGDEITLQITLDDGADRKVHSITWQGEGCSISQASASIMSELVEGQSVEEVQHLDELFHELMNSRGKGLSDAAEDELGDATAFTGVSQYPARIKCALLGWAALKDSLVRAGALAAAE